MELYLQWKTDVKRLIFLILTTILWSPALAAELRLEVDLSERQLLVMVDDQVIETFAVSVGKEKNPTPEGEFKIKKVIWNPSWKPPDAKWARGKTAKPPGHPENPMKRVKMFAGLVLIGMAEYYFVKAGYGM